MMETKFSQFLFCILVVLLLQNSSHADHHHPHSAMNFLEPLVGTTKGDSAEGISKLKNHLSNLGYLNNIITSEESSDYFDDNLEEAITRYQSYFKLPPTGTLDATTLAHMHKPRCGVADFFRNSSAHYTFFPGRPKWGKRDLTYSFPPGTRRDVYKAIEDATHLWSSVSPLKFRYVEDYNSADVKISFQVRDHGDGSRFDGSRGILAHAFAPTDGRLHFDGDEKWVDGVVGGQFDLQTVGAHELGHVLGLGHSPDGDSIMHPTIGDGFRKLLGLDDVNGIRDLYPS